MNNLIRFFFVSALFIGIGNLRAQTKLIAKISDADTKKSIQNVHIVSIGKKIIATTNENGIAEINLTTNEENILKISHISYKDTLISLAPKDNLAELNIELQILNIKMPEVIVSASRKLQLKDYVAGSNDIITQKDIEIQPITNIDNILQSISNVYVNRSWGIFSKNASVTMRGMDGKDRVLILLDGVPMNKSAGGSINWHLINPQQIERIEIIKGPVSALYGNNAMNGIINLISKEPNKKLEFYINSFIASYNTIGGNFSVGGKQKLAQNNFSWNLNGFYRQGDGYFYTPENLRNIYDSKLYLQEYNSSAKIGYEFSNKQKIEISHSYQHDKRGAGRKIYMPDGSFDSYTTNLSSINYTGIHQNTKSSINLFWQNELYQKQSESINSSGNYKLSENPQISNDFGILSSFSTQISEKLNISYGFDYKQASLHSEEIYKTSSDYIKRNGNLIFGGVYLQNEWFLNTKWLFTSGLRLDYSTFYNSKLIVNNPTKETGFLTNIDQDFPQNDWYALSPKFSLKFLQSNKFNTYLSAAKGFRPPTIDDLCSSRKITKGFKIANPNLLPEYQYTFEYGFQLKPIKNVKISAALYFTKGFDFQYFVGTGDSIDTGGSTIKPVLRRENISKVNVAGFEFDVTYSIGDFMEIKANYTQNSAKIIEFNLINKYETSLNNNYLIETPSNQAFLGINSRNKWLNMSLIYNYIGEQWADEENTQLINSYNTIDLSFSRKIGKYFQISIDIQNITNEKFIDKKGYESPGRFCVVNFAYQL